MPRDPLFEAEIPTEMRILSSEFRKNIENEKQIIDCKSLTVRDKKINKKVKFDF